jgi:menaquinone-dependent protoporphyrinogen oxidase
MDKKVLVAYASKYGATAEIAQKIGEVLKQGGLDVQVSSVKEVTKPEQYGAVVLGSALYIGQWRKEAAEFLKNNAKLLSAMPVWLFSSGPSGEGDPIELVQGALIPSSLQPVVDNINPRDITVFHGNLDLSRLGFLEKMAIKNIKAPTGDFRDWKDITSWANSIVEALKK